MKTLVFLVFLLVSVLYSGQTKRETKMAADLQSLADPNNLYYYTPNGSGGVNYFENLGTPGSPISPTPISREIFQAGTGFDPGVVEKYVSGLGSAPPSGGNIPTAGGGSTGTTGPDNSQQIAQYNAAINNQLPAQLAAGTTNINNSYQSALQQLLQGKNVADRNYGTAKQQSATDYVGAKNTIGAQAGSTLNGLLRLLGSRGAGASSASDVARQAVTRGAGLQRTDVGNTFGQNNQALDTNYGDYTNQYNQQVAGAGTQRQAAQESLQNQINQSKSSLLQQIAGLQSSPANAQPYLDQANSILQSLAQYVPPQINYQTPAYQAPSLASYANNPQTTPTYNNQSSDYFSPYLSTLLGKKQQTATA